MDTILHLIESFLGYISYWDKQGILNFVGLVLSTIIPILIMIFTLRSEKKSAKKDAAEREQQYKENLRIAEQHHNEQLNAQEEINRVAIMPYLTIENISAEIQCDRMIFPISFKNIGNGTAINLTTKYLESNTFLCPVYETNLATYCCIKPFDAYTAIARPDERCNFTIAQEIKATTLPNADCCCFTLKYTDMKQQSYEQTFAIYFDAKDLEDIKIQRKIVNNPEPK